ncbi:MAG: hypothetical protein HYW48_12330 [Deltaproteobacteria bacterium]|nr:hypothetical protein [Deltaproteobacteria bacterium]
MHKTLIISAFFQFGAVAFASDGAQVSQPGNYNCTVMCQECGDSPTCAGTKLKEQNPGVHFCPPLDAYSEWPTECWMTPQIISSVFDGCAVGATLLAVSAAFATHSIVFPNAPLAFILGFNLLFNTLSVLPSIGPFSSFSNPECRTPPEREALLLAKLPVTIVAALSNSVAMGYSLRGVILDTGDAIKKYNAKALAMTSVALVLGALQLGMGILAY